MPTVRQLNSTRPSSILKAERTSPRLRGYTSQWDRFSVQYRRRFPFCVECRRAGRLTLTDVVVDHKFPVADGGAVLPGDDGVWTLCRPHHAAKTDMEDFARSSGQLDMITFWCDNPQSRPPELDLSLRGCMEDGSEA